MKTIADAAKDLLMCPHPEEAKKPLGTTAAGRTLEFCIACGSMCTPDGETIRSALVDALAEALGDPSQAIAPERVGGLIASSDELEELLRKVLHLHRLNHVGRAASPDEVRKAAIAMPSAIRDVVTAAIVVRGTYAKRDAEPLEVGGR